MIYRETNDLCCKNVQNKYIKHAASLQSFLMLKQVKDMVTVLYGVYQLAIH